ncbi:alpha-aspartyl dipeptidase-like isoform X3 [Ictalurus furcatus]|uniref:alpha-aspartyl dipeptidase-like isoform X3 n=1 Tax=Ictalurus furcatus TaxID=66913 RepID=UPI0023506E1F|nr:alpha-aspartyl dipeptidase-like isoform X3 [Ictalurus furcatus]
MRKLGAVIMNRRLLLVSNSTLYGGGYLQHCQNNISHFFGKQVKRVLFVPYALHDQDAYTKTARDKLKSLGYEVDSVHEAADPVEAVRKAEAIFIGGGNTFRLLKALYDNNLVTEIKKRVLQDGVPYMGSSAGTNVATETREQRITQYHEELNTPCVLGLREGSMLLVEGNTVTLLGTTNARLFQRGKEPSEHVPGSDLSFLLTDAQ